MTSNTSFESNDEKNIPNSLGEKIVFKSRQQPKHTLCLRSSYRPEVTVHGCTSNADIDRLLTIHKSAAISIFLHFVHGKRRNSEVLGLRMGRNGQSDLSNQEKWSTSKGGLISPKLFRLDRTDPFSFGPKLPEILLEWIAPSLFPK